MGEGLGPQEEGCGAAGGGRELGPHDKVLECSSRPSHQLSISCNICGNNNEKYAKQIWYVRYALSVCYTRQILLQLPSQKNLQLYNPLTPKSGQLQFFFQSLTRDISYSMVNFQLDSLLR